MMMPAARCSHHDFGHQGSLTDRAAQHSTPCISAPSMAMLHAQTQTFRLGMLSTPTHLQLITLAAYTPRGTTPVQRTTPPAMFLSSCCLPVLSCPTPSCCCQIHWSRAARTDKGVSALCQVVSAKLMIEPKDTFAERVNEHLPSQVGAQYGFCAGLCTTTASSCSQPLLFAPHGCISLSTRRSVS